MVIIGLTGNYGMGKSTVARMFRELGAIVIDTDDIVRELLKDVSVIAEIKSAFGDEIMLDGSVNKKMLADAVFGRSDFRISLENILHPKVFDKINEFVRNSELMTHNPKLFVVEAPVIFERGYQNRFDRIITVFTSVEVAISRLGEKGISEEDARKRLNSQFPIEMKISKADYTIDNSKDLEDTRRQVEGTYKILMLGISKQN